MKMAVLATFLTLLLAISHSESRILSPRIINGENATTRQFPYMVSILICPPSNETDRYCNKCGGSIISKSFVLSAAHCFYRHSNHKYPENSVITVKAGSLLDVFSDYPETKIQTVRAKHFKIHPSYDWLLNRGLDTFAHSYDVAIIHLSTNFKFNADVTRVKLAPPTYNSDGKSAIVSGWGSNDFFDQDHSNHVLKYVKVEVMAQSDCRRYFYKIVPGNMICTFRHGKGFCGGDSGGPLVVTDRGVRKQIGIVSFSPAFKAINGIQRDLCAAAPDYYVSVAHFYDYIVNTMRCMRKFENDRK